jgi:hypothetical protein
MKKIFLNFLLLFFVILFLLIIVLSTSGIETNKFNNFITKKATQTKNIYLDLDKIKFKIDIKEFSLFLETQTPEISYREIVIPVRNIKVYIDFLDLIKSKINIKKISIILEELDIIELKKLSAIIKPSNFKSILNNKIKKGKLISTIEIFFNDNGELKNFITKGVAENLEAELINGLTIKDVKLNFFADKNDILIKNIFGNLDAIKLLDGDIKLNLEKGIKINSNFDSHIKFNEKYNNKYLNSFKKFKFSENIKNLEGIFNNNIYIDIDNTYKIKDYNYSLSGKIKKTEIELPNPINNDFLADELKIIYFSDLKINSDFKPNNILFNGEGNYSLDNTDYLDIKFENKFHQNSSNFKLDFNYEKGIEVDFINYVKDKDSIANISLELEKKKKNLKINKFLFKEDDDFIKIQDLELNDTNLLSFKKIDIKTKGNEFTIQNKNKIIIKGKKFDATNLPKFFTKQNEDSIFKKINRNIEIDFNNIKAPMAEKLENFKLLGEIQKGKFVKIISKGDFGGNNYLDISMKKDKNSTKKYLEIYSDLTRPLLTEFSFFNGLSGGKLLFTSIIEETKSISKLKIENFKLVNAPGVVQLLSLADLGGLADLAKGEGLSFDVLEISMEKNKDLLKLNEILALGPSMSVLMEGYQGKDGLTSLRGTLVPAKTLNKIISKIPLIGKIVIPKEIGEGLFGISFKMKGPKGKIKTTINPIRTLTPRFIQKIVDKKKEAN